jgi:NTP pyrophosphatase (non-canonical NTP hydrolase)
MFDEIYSEKNKSKTIEELFLHVVEEAGELAEALRKDTLDEITKNLPDLFAWLCEFVSKIGSQLEDVVWNKFPNVCPYCLKEENCICIAHMKYLSEKEREVQLSELRKKKEKMPITLEEWFEMFRRIYGNVNKVMHFSDIGFHFMEEVGEVARGTKNRNNHRITERDSRCFRVVERYCNEARDNRVV